MSGDGGGFLKAALAWRLIAGVTGVFALVVGWQALDLDRHEELAAHADAAVALAVTSERDQELASDVARIERKIDRGAAETSGRLKDIERALLALQLERPARRSEAPAKGLR